eukprot:3252134-Amphidinium_carterae.1
MPASDQRAWLGAAQGNRVVKVLKVNPPASKDAPSRMRSGEKHMDLCRRFSCVHPQCHATVAPMPR